MSVHKVSSFLLARYMKSKSQGQRVILAQNTEMSFTKEG